MMAERGENFKGDGRFRPFPSYDVKSMIVLQGPDIERSGALSGNRFGDRENAGERCVIGDFLQKGCLAQRL